jgi:uncharacterized protein YacL
MAFVLVFALIGGFLAGSSAQALLTWIYELLSRNAKPSPAELQAFRAMVGSAVSIIPIALIGALAGAFVGNIFLGRVDRMVERWDKMHTGDKVTMFLGVFAGIIMAVPVLLLFQYVPGADPGYKFFGILALTLGFIVIAIYTLQSMAEILPWNRGRATSRRSGVKLLDTNVIIDGRVYDVVRAGFLDGQIYVPGFVLDELQHIADSHDNLRRQRGRRGLDVLRHMQADFNLEVRVHDRFAPDLGDGVDARLVRLAKALGADIVTNDFNLNRVAALQEVKVLSLNDLALALRSNIMPQETLELTVNREGNQPGQGIGYLEDGTMVVVENGKTHIGETLDVIVTQVIQTERGKMIFAEAEPGGDNGGGLKPRKRGH